MRKNYEASAAKGKLTPSRSSKAMGLLNPTLDFAALADCDLIIEAVYEDMDVKKEVFGRLDKIAKPGAILASNTSYLNIDEIAASISRPGDVVGMHFFSPANVMKLLEVVRGAKTAPDVLLTAMQLGKTHQEGRGGRGRVPRLHRQPHADAAPDRGDQAAARRREPRAGRPRPCRVRDADGAVPDGRPRRASTSAGTATPIGSRISATRCARSTAGARRRAPASTIMTTSAGRRRRRWSSRSSRISRRSRASSGARSPTRRSSSARSTRWSTRARKSSRKASPSAPRTSMWCGSTATAGRSIAAGRCSGPTRVGLDKIVEGLKRQEERMRPEFSFSQLLLDKAEKGERFTR